MCGSLKQMTTLTDSVNAALQYGADEASFRRDIGMNTTDEEFCRFASYYINGSAVPASLREATEGCIKELVADKVRRPIVRVYLWD